MNCRATDSQCDKHSAVNLNINHIQKVKLGVEVCVSHYLKGEELAEWEPEGMVRHVCIAMVKYVFSGDVGMVYNWEN